MTCKIERVLTPDGFVVLRVRGLAIDLTEVTLVSPEAVEALAVAETNGIELRNCPANVREWVSRAKESHD
jgi:hypothetical protein